MERTVDMEDDIVVGEGWMVKGGRLETGSV